MKIRAVAAADARSNAIGTLELECTDHGLVIDYLGVGAFNEGFAPGALTHGTRVTVPWRSIVECSRYGEGLYLEIPQALSPHHRLWLRRFSVGDPIHHHELYRRRLTARIGTATLALIAALTAGATLAKLSPTSGASTAIVVAVAAALVILFLGFIADRGLVHGSVADDVVRDTFVAQLGPYFPGLVQDRRGELRAPNLPKALELPLPRGTFAIAATLSAGGLAAVLVVQSLGRGEERAERDFHHPAPQADLVAVRAPAPLPPPPAAPPAAPAAPLPATARPAAASAAQDAPAAAASGKTLGTLQTGGGCRCERADSALWVGPLPKLSVLVLSSRLEQRRSTKRLLLDIAVVNNSNAELSDITLNVNFFEREGATAPRQHSAHRVLFFAGPLAPAKAIKWSAEADGTEFELENPVAGDVGNAGEGAASASRVLELLDANHRPVRLHGAMLLSYLGDPRAKEAALKLRDALRDEEASYLRRVLLALEPIKVCDVAIEATGLRACVFNGSTQDEPNLALKLRALAGPVLISQPIGDPPLVLSEQAWRLPAPLAAGTGITVLTPLHDAKLAGAQDFEAFAAREDLLP